MLALNIVLGLSFAAAFIFAIASFVFAGKQGLLNATGDTAKATDVVGINAGEGFLAVCSALSALGFIGAAAFFFNKRLGKITYGYYLASTCHVMLSTLAIAVWAGWKMKALDSLSSVQSSLAVTVGDYSGAVKGVIAGAVLTLFFQTAFFVMILFWRASLSAGEGEANTYGGPTTYQPNATYANYDAPAPADAAGQGYGGAQGYQGGEQYQTTAPGQAL